MERILQLAKERPLVYLPSHDLNAGERLQQEAQLLIERQRQYSYQTFV